MAWLLDTNVIASLIAHGGAPSVKAWARSQDENAMFLSVLTLAEYDKGIAKLPADSTDRARYQAALDALEVRFAGRILPVSNAIVRRWGVLSGRIHRDLGSPPSVIDTLLAATALEHDIVLVTRNTQDVAASGVRLFNPWEAG